MSVEEQSGSDQENDEDGTNFEIIDDPADEAEATRRMR
jgi:hypothetical protein